MNKDLVSVRKGFLQALGAALFGVLWTKLPMLAKWAFGLVLTDTQVLIIRIALGLCGLFLLGTAVCLHCGNLRKKLRAMEQENEKFRISSLEQKRGRTDTTYNAVVSTLDRNQNRPSQNAFEVLKLFNSLGPQSALSVNDVSGRFKITREETIGLLSELRDFRFIYTVIFAKPAPWQR
jgi:hypothetical protein